ncbi:MAG: D-alanyl-D-alanine carboxypeptidase/D-alanyl-D-alanine-endopeptidase [Gemmatimonadota bacterium]|nr:D-alanyl-D-alanine carboxypeptidase/D-alanyl-D-alanine-endopeptidase [Gemmatimonadota bacterium]
MVPEEPLALNSMTVGPTVPALPTSAITDLRQDLSGLLDTPSMGRAQWSVLVVSLDRGDTLFSRDANRPLTPASNMKIVTTAVALHFLGPRFRYQTFVFADGPVVDGRLQGDLILYGTGDPGNSDRFFRGRPGVFEQLVSQVAEEGITHIDGAVVGDATYFSGPDLGPEWDPLDLNESFAAGASSLSFNENVITLQIIPAERLGSPPRVETIPGNFSLPMDNVAETVSRRPRPRLWLDRVTPTALIRMDGEIRQGGPNIWRRLTVPDPALFAAHAFRQALDSEGIAVSEADSAIHLSKFSRITGRQSWAPRLIGAEEPRLIARHTSVELIDYLTVMNQESHNLFAETILKTVAKVAQGEGSFKGGAQAIRSYTAGVIGLSGDQIQATDGSGLSGRNRASAGAFVHILAYVAKSAYWESFLSTLPQAGRSLRRMYRTPAARNLTAKTGTIDGVSALTGVVTARDGETLLFSILSNDVVSTSAAKRVENQFGMRLAEFRRDAEASSDF